MGAPHGTAASGGKRPSRTLTSGGQIHSNARIELPSLDGIPVTPECHRIHLPIRPEHHSKNFADMFPAFGMVVGSYVRPEKGDLPETGPATVGTKGRIAPKTGPKTGVRSRCRGTAQPDPRSCAGRSARGVIAA